MHEAITVVLAIITGLVGLVLALLSSVLKDAQRRLDKISDQVTVNSQGLKVLESSNELSSIAARLAAQEQRSNSDGQRLAVLENSGIGTRIEGHEARLRALENGLADLSSDMKVVRSILENASNKRAPKQ